MNYIEDKYLPFGTIGEMAGMSRSRIYAIRETDARFPKPVDGRYSLFGVIALICLKELEAMTPIEFLQSRRADSTRIEVKTDKQTKSLIKKCYTEINAENAADALSQTIGDYIQMLQRYA